MSEKYLIDKASLTALADITRAYNETPDKEYSLEEVTEQVKEASETLHDMFGEGITELRSETATEIGDYAFSGISKETEPYMSIYLPNVTHISAYAFRNSYIGKVYMPNVRTTGTTNGGVFFQTNIYRSVYMPLLEELKQNDFSSCYLYGHIYLPNLQTMSNRAFALNGETGYMILKSLPVVSSVIAQANANRMRFFVKAGLLAEMETATNWNYVVLKGTVREATTYEADYEDIWKMLVEDGFLTEEEIRRDFYAES